MSLLQPADRALPRPRRKTLKEQRRPLRRRLRAGEERAAMPADHQEWAAWWLEKAKIRRARGHAREQAILGILREAFQLAVSKGTSHARDFVIDAAVGHPAIDDVADTPEGRAIAGGIWDIVVDALDGD